MQDLTSKKLDHLIVDTGAIIRGAANNLFNLAENIWTISDVIDEVRDSKSRSLLESLPFSFKLRQPSAEAIKFVVDFSKKSGDFQFLSSTDLKILALTYMIEKEFVGDQHLRKKPKQQKVDDNESEDDHAINSSPNQQQNVIVPKKTTPPSERSINWAQVVQLHTPNEEKKDFEESLTDTQAPSCQMEKQTSELQLKTTVKLSKSHEEEDDDEEDDDEEEDDEEDDEDDDEDDDDDEDADDDDEEEEEEDHNFDDEDQVEGGNKQNKKFVMDDNEFPDISSVATNLKNTDLNDQDPLQTQYFPLQTNHSAQLDKILSAISQPTSKTTSVKQIESESNESTLQESINKKVSKSVTSHILSMNNQMNIFPLDSDVCLVDDNNEGWINSSNYSHYKFSGNGIYSMTKKPTKGKNNGSNNKPDSVAELSTANETSATLKETDEIKQNEPILIRDENKKIVQSPVGCITTDFTMQNVLLQIGLQLYSLDGIVIRRIKNWVLRCYACLHITDRLGKKFCPKCGGTTLTRVTVTTDQKTGQKRLHLKKGYKINTRGKKYSLPNPGQHGKFEGEILLREDQLKAGIWKQKMQRRKHQTSSIFGEDITESLGMNVRKIDSIVIGLGKKNPNESKGHKKGRKKRH